MNFKIFLCRVAFPDGQLRRVTSGVNVQYVLAGIKRKANPLPVKSRTDSPPVSGATTPHSLQQRVPQVEQNVPRTSSLPAANQVLPSRNTPRPQLPPQTMPISFDLRSGQVAGVTQQQQPSAIRQVARKPSFSNEGTVQTPFTQVSVFGKLCKGQIKRLTFGLSLFK